MLLYNIRIAIKSLKRTPWLTALVITAIALGICISTTFTAVRHIFSKDPIPGQSERLFWVRMDNWDPARPYVLDDPKSLPSQVTNRDMRELMKSNIPTHQGGTFEARYFIFPDPKVARPYSSAVRVVFSDFFTMFRVPFKYGSGWDRAADAKPEQVVVIDDDTNQKLFGGVNSVGKTVRIDERTFKVVGVLAPWRPAIRYYDLTRNPSDKPDPFYIPFNFVPIMEIRPAGNVDGWKSCGNTYAEFLNCEVNFIQFWVELPDQQHVAAYRDFVNAYTRDQRKIGRFLRPFHNEVKSLPEMMKEFQIVPRQISSMSTVSLLFLVVCSLNLVGLLLGKFLARVPEVSVRRALGATRLQVFWQHIVECEVVGVIGGAIGLALSVGLLMVIAKAMPNGDSIHLDGEMVLASVFLSLVAGLFAGIYPAWRICTVPPAMQLKIQ